MTGSSDPTLGDAAPPPGQEAQVVSAQDGTPVAVFAAGGGGGINYDLYESDGTNLIALGGPYTTGPYDFVALNGEALFDANQDLYASNGTAKGTVKIAAGVGPYEITPIGTLAVFAGIDPGTGGNGLWVTDGTASGTSEIVSGKFVAVSAAGSLMPGQGLLGRQVALSIGTEALFSAYDANGADQLWETDGTTAGTKEVAFGPYQLTFIAGGHGPIGLIPQDLVQTGNMVLFDGLSDTNGQGLYSLNIGTGAVTDINAAIAKGNSQNPVPSDAQTITSLGNGLATLFAVNGSDQTSLWATDGSVGGTTRLIPYLSVAGMVALGNKAIFAGEELNASGSAITPWGLWITDGTSAGTSEFFTGLPTSDPIPSQLTVFGGLVVFSGSGTGLWQTDGTAANTQEITTDGSIDLTEALVVNGQLLFNEGKNVYSIDGFAGDGTEFVSSVPLVNQQGSNVPYFAVLCFRAGTRILTPDGDVPVENLAPGDPVLTHDGEVHAITWIGRRHIDCRRHPRPEAVQPVRIAAGAFGAGSPRRDLYLSPDHAVFVDGVLIPARLLINGSSICQTAMSAVTYFHVELASHEILVVEGLPAESYLDVGTRDNFVDTGGAMRLFPDRGAMGVASHLGVDQRGNSRWGVFPSGVSLAWEGRAHAPLSLAGDAVERVRRRVAREAPAKA